jgi:hypothetical protein
MMCDTGVGISNTRVILSITSSGNMISQGGRTSISDGDGGADGGGETNGTPLTFLRIQM